MRPFFLAVVLISFIFQVTAQDVNSLILNDKSSTTNEDYSLFQKKKKILLISEASLYSFSLLALNQLWYADYPRSSFHFINDNNEWLQMDKLGHMSASYYSGVAGIQAYRWAGFSRKQSIWYGGMTGSLFLTIVEILDGTSKEWGASAGDLFANTTGSFLAIGQALRWDEQRIQLKYSYAKTKWALQNPSQLGSNVLERALKDYNGQTYWLTFNIKSLFNIQENYFPKWISLAFGYGGSSMIKPSPTTEDNRYRQYYFSFDIDLNKINTNNSVFNSILHAIGFLKFPLPTLEFSNGNLFFHPIYY